MVREKTGFDDHEIIGKIIERKIDGVCFDVLDTSQDIT